MMRVGIIAVFISIVSGLTVYIEPNNEQCFFDVAERGDKIMASFLVAQGGALDIDVQVYGPDNRIVYEAQRQKDDSFQFVAVQPGPYRLCFGNKMSTVTGKTVTFNLYVGNALAHKNAAKTEHLDPLENAVMILSEGLRSVQDSQEYMKFRERVCRNTNESTNTRVFWWSMLEFGVMLTASLSQIWFLRQMFERTTKA